MQNRNVIKIFAILFAIVCLYQLSFTFIADGVEEDAMIYAADSEESEIEAKAKFYLDSINSEEVYDILLTSYTYAECKQREINLGLDLKGGMNVTLEVMVVDVVKALSNNSKDSVFNVAIANTLKAQEDSQDDFPTLFGQEYEKLSPSNGMAVLFMSQLKDKIKNLSQFKSIKTMVISYNNNIEKIEFYGDYSIFVESLLLNNIEIRTNEKCSIRSMK